MFKIISIVFIFLIYLFRYVPSNLENKNTNYLFVSLFVVSIPFQINFPIWEFGIHSLGGTLGNKLYVFFPFIFYFVCLFFLKRRHNYRLQLNKDKWILFIFMLIVISFLNTQNQTKSGTIIFFVFFFSHILLFDLFAKRISKDQVLKGILDGLIVLSLIQFILAICFPLLKMINVTTLFHSSGIEGATRFGTRVGAIGTFIHPGNLGLFLIMANSFFFAAYLKGYKKKIFKYILLINVLTLFLTFSRTTYLGLILALSLIYIYHKNAQKKIITLGNFFKYLLPTTVFLIWLIFASPLSESFLKTDSSDQLNNRLIHYFMAYNALNESPLLGIGINAHVELFMNKLSLSNSITLEEFFISNPVHNIHLIILIETGIVGFILWLFFIFNSFSKSKEYLKKKQNEIMNLSFAGSLLGFVFYGLTGWAPLSQGILPFFLLFSFFTYRFNNSK
jgi:O-antigen ligase